MEYVTADRFIPIEFDARGRLVNVVFVQVKKLADDDFYHRFEHHDFDAETGTLTIANTAFHSDSAESIGRRIDLKDVDEWKEPSGINRYTYSGKAGFRVLSKPDQE